MDMALMPFPATFWDQLDQLKADYCIAWRRFPREMLTLKWINFCYHFADYRCGRPIGSSYLGPVAGGDVIRGWHQSAIRAVARPGREDR